MTIVVTCSQGHVLEVGEHLAGTAAQCPRCAEAVEIPASPHLSDPAPSETAELPRPAVRPRGLWQVMNKPADAPARHTGDDSSAEPAASGPPTPQTPVTPGARRAAGLWALMNSPAAPVENPLSPPARPSPPAPPGPTAAYPPPPPPTVSPTRSLWLRGRPTPTPGAGVPAAPPPPAAMTRPGTPNLGAPNPALPPVRGTPPPPEPEDLRSAQPVEDEAAEEAIELEPFFAGHASPAAPLARTAPHLAGTSEMLPVGPAVPLVISLKAVRSGRSRAGVWALVLGALAVPASLLAVIPAFWSKVPAMACGLAALVLGNIAVGEIRRSRGRITGLPWARAGIGLGACGILLGPMVISRLGLWDDNSLEYSRMHLEQVGTALDGYYDENGQYPSGGTYFLAPSGKSQHLHGWLTRLLPYIGEQELFAQIQLDQPWDGPLNLEPMSRTVPPFLSGGGPRRLPVGEYGITHFAGVGGDVVLPNDAGVAQAGVFGVNSEVTREDIFDGLSNTLIVGEISRNYPAWGDTRNWRIIGRGLNIDAEGFGNAAGTGAHFLMGDGSVRFFANQVDRRLLEKLSTRDGEETLPTNE